MELAAAGVVGAWSCDVSDGQVSIMRRSSNWLGSGEVLAHATCTCKAHSASSKTSLDSFVKTCIHPRWQPVIARAHRPLPRATC
jgi:hypothetical protein